MIGQIRRDEARHPYVFIGWWETETEYRSYVEVGGPEPRLRVKVDLAEPTNSSSPLVNASNGLLTYEDVPLMIQLLEAAKRVIEREKGTQSRFAPPAFSGAEGDDR